MTIILKYKPDFEEVKEAYKYFWAGADWKRPLVWAKVLKPVGQHLEKKISTLADYRYYRAINRRWDEQCALIDTWLENTFFLGEDIPYFIPDFGPDQFAAYLGAPMHFSESSSNTSWVEPIVRDWADFEVKLEETNAVWKGVRDYAAHIAKHAAGRYLVGIGDFHSNLDAASGLRGAQNLCLDLIDCPDEVERCMLKIRALYAPVYNAIYQAAGMNAATGSLGWGPFWCEDKFAVIQCDFSYMIGSGDFRRFVMPAIEEEAAFLDHSMYHLDGCGALTHLDDVLSIKDIDVLQWVAGSGQKPMWQWTEILKKGLAAGKALHIYDITPEQVKLVHRELKSRRCLYQITAQTRSEVEELLKWLEHN